VDDVWRSLPNASTISMTKYDYHRIFIGLGRSSARPSKYTATHCARRVPRRRTQEADLLQNSIFHCTIK